MPPREFSAWGIFVNIGVVAIAVSQWLMDGDWGIAILLVTLDQVGNGYRRMWIRARWPKERA